MAEQPFPAPSLSRPTRRGVVVTGATLLAGFGLDAVAPAAAHADPGGGTSRELARHRPVRVSSTDYAPTPASFAVDGLDAPGPRGSGWRAAAGDPQWISVDLQAQCRVSRVGLVFEAAAGDPVFTPPTTGNPRTGTTGKENLSSYATAFDLEVSRDGRTWQRVHRVTDGKGGRTEVTLSRPVTCRWVRFTARERSGALPLGLNGFAVWGDEPGHRPTATGWTDWGTRHHAAPALALADDGTVPVESGWVLTMDDRVKADGAALSRPTVDTSGWLPALVPGTVLGALVEQGKLPDPVAGLNNLHIPEALSRHTWWYKRDFATPRGLRTGRGRRVWLEFDGVNHAAEVWLNGRRAGELSHPFARAALDVTALLATHGENALAVRVSPMPVPGSPGDKGPAGESWVDAGAEQMNKNSPTYLASSGWDWMPAVRDRGAGIWNHVRLRATGQVVIGDPRVDTVLPKLPDTSVAEVTVIVPVRNADTRDHSVRVEAAFDGVKVARNVTVRAGEETEAVLAPDAFTALRLRHPKLWWPNGLGEPHLYGLRLTASVDGTESDRRTTRFGVRQFGYAYEIPLPFGTAEDAAVQSVDLGRRSARYVRLNCGERATDWGFSLWTLAVRDSERPGTDLALHAEATASSTDGDGGAAAHATDGDPRTRWSSAYEDGQWLRVDLGAEQDFDRLDLTWERAYARTFTVQVSSDGDSWTEVASVDNSALPLSFGNADASLRVTEFPEVTARWVRLACGKRATSWGNSLWSLSVPHEGKDLAREAAVSASSEESDHPAAHATDGRDDTRWSSQAEDGQWIALDFGGARTFDRVAALWERAYPKTYTVQVSDDGRTWKDVASVDNTPKPLRLSVNGVPVLARGGNWGWDELLRRMPEERLDAAVRMHRDMNFTMIRNWVGSCDREEFFAKCDEYGILVWNDFPNAWGMDAPDHDVFVAQARDTVLRYRIHPSVVVWCGANEGDPPAAIDQGMREAVADLAPGLLYQNNSAGGIATGGGPYGYVEPESYFSADTYGSGSFGFHTEIGMPVASTAESLRAMTGDEPEWPIGGAWYHHDWSENGNQAPQHYKAAIERRLGTAHDLDDFARKAQFVNYDNARAMFEAWNAHLWEDATGLMLWMSHPAWHSTVWQTYDYDFDVNGTYYGARSACEPVHVQADPEKGEVLALNHTGKALKDVRVEARLYALDGRQLGRTRSTRLDVPAAAKARAFTSEFTAGLPELHLLRLTLSTSGGRVLSENTYWRHRTPEAMRAIGGLPDARLTLTALGRTRKGDREEVRVRVGNRGHAVAAMTRLSLREERGGERVLPTLYSDNYLWLLPGETRTVTLSWPRAAGHARLTVRAEPFNGKAAVAGA
ncbi:discoidin domain-containing protein [Streptomyces sp. CA-253872]|uniref:discoidin domain-containing protein n=1 Tax=Streptomyces sp. CA-253872 TaxID=3240067 RepID=UPI003D914C24